MMKGSARVYNDPTVWLIRSIGTATHPVAKSQEHVPGKSCMNLAAVQAFVAEVSSPVAFVVALSHNVVHWNLAFTTSHSKTRLEGFDVQATFQKLRPASNALEQGTGWPCTS